MPNNDLLNHISAFYPKLTNSERKVADFVLSSPREVLNATISDFADMCGVGDTTVFRFCRSLHLGGYQDFRLSLALTVNSNELLDSGGIGQAYKSDAPNDLCKGVYNAYLQGLEEAYKKVDLQAVSKTVDLMLQAKIIYLFGFGGSASSALEAQNKLLKITPNVVFNSDSHLQLTTAALLGEKDLAIILSNSGITKDCIRIARLVKEAHASVVFITQFAKTPALQYADVLLLCGAKEGPLEGGSIAAKLSQIFTLDVIYTEFFRRMGSMAEKNKKLTSAATAEKML